VHFAAGAADGLERVRELGSRLSGALAELPADHVLVVLLEEDAGTALGGYATGWRARDAGLVVLDQLAPREAAFVTVGSAKHGVVPVAFHGLR
jgi:ethanolamine utilization protein EutA (predicted chaperonin)